MPTTSIFAFIGSDEARASEAALATVRRLSPADAGDFGTDVIDGQADNADGAEAAVFNVIQSLRTLPFFGGGKVVWLKNATFLGDTQTGNAETTKNAVEKLSAELAKGLPAEIYFVLSSPNIDKRRAFFLGLNKLSKAGHCTIESFDKVDISRVGWEEKLAPLVQQRAKSIGLGMDRATAEHFVRLVGEDTRQLDSELVKLRTYVGSNTTASRDDIRAVVSKSRGGIVFEIGTAIGKRDLPDALSLLEHFLDLDESPVSIIRAGIIPTVRRILVMSDLLGRHRFDTRNYNNFQADLGRLPESAIAHLPRNKAGDISAYPLFLSCESARNYTADELVDAMDACLEADRCLVNTGLDAPLVLSQLLVRIMRKQPSPAKATR
jgi:DNA polymerase-3 subunit delta